MIQAPQTQYMPQTMPPMNNYQQPVSQPQPMAQDNQNQGGIYNYPVASSYMPANGKPQFNGVNIEINNPQGVGAFPGNGQQMPAQFAPVQHPIYFPPYQPVVQQPAMPVNTPVDVQQPAAAPMPVDNTAPAVPAPQIAPAAPDNQNVQPPVVEQPVAPDSSITPEAFAGKLKTDDVDAQKAAIEEIAQLVKEDQTAGPILLDTQIFDALLEVVNKDTTALAGPTPDVVELRNKPQDQLTEDEKVKASTPTPLEKAEMNKQYALYTIAYMQERLNKELEQRNGAALELKDLPCIENVINAAKANQNPMVRTGAIAALSHIARPEYKADLQTIFDLAKADEDPNVQDSANKAIEALNQK